MFSSTAPLETPDLRPGAPEKDGELMKPQLPVKLPETLKLQEMLGKSMVNTWKHVINGHKTYKSTHNTYHEIYVISH